MGPGRQRYLGLPLQVDVCGIEQLDHTSCWKHVAEDKQRIGVGLVSENAEQVPLHEHGDSVTHLQRGRSGI